MGLIKEVRSELRAEIRGMGQKLEKQIHEVKAEVHGLNAQVQEVIKSVHHTQVFGE